MSIKIDIKFSRGGVIDRCGNTWTGSPLVSDEKTKWNTESYRGVPRTNVYTSNPIDFDIGTGDYTLEAWVYSLSQDQNAGIMQLSSYVGGLTTDQDRSLVLGGSYSWIGIYGDYWNHGVDVGHWRHYALVRYNGFLLGFIDGGVVYGKVNNIDLSNLRYVGVGNYYNNEFYWNGYIDSIRVANHAIYTRDFIPKMINNNKWLYIAEDNKVYGMR